MLNRARWIGVAGALSLLLLACTGDGSKPSASLSTASTAVLPVLATYDPQGLAMDALQPGVLRFEPRGRVLCSYLGSTPVLWPEGFSSDGNALRDANGNTVAAAGETLSIGGGSVPMSGTACAPDGQNVWRASGEIVKRRQP